MAFVGLFLYKFDKWINPPSVSGSFILIKYNTLSP